MNPESLRGAVEGLGLGKSPSILIDWNFQNEVRNALARREVALAQIISQATRRKKKGVGMQLRRSNLPEELLVFAEPLGNPQILNRVG